MKNVQDINEVLGKIEDIRGFFKIGDEVIPFLGDLFLFLRDIMPLMSEVNISLKDSTSKLPTASDKISTATETAELATHEILDKLDSISSKLALLSDDVREDKKNIIDEIQADVSDTIYALQFQDITSQQLEHANRILAAIYDKFVNLFKSVENLKIGTKVGDRVISAIEMGIDEKKIEKERREFEERTRDKMRQESISQDDIDQLFS